jgi:class 3 adenylate cyclase/tetratricopeptide (TPR) repeat protein
MHCPACGFENAATARFCVDCGQRLEQKCPACGHVAALAAKFCDQCGHRLEASTLRESPRTPPAPAPIGERRQATVLFSDLSGYTAMNERLDPEEVRGIVGRIKAEAVRIVEGHGGIVNQFVGDEVVALFGIPLAHEDDPVRAVRAARDLHAMVRAMSPEVEGRIGAPLRLHTGISTGLIVTGTEDRRDGTYGITGDAVNTGARLASHAASDAVLVSEETQRLIADFFQAEPLEPVELKGKSGLVTPYRVIEQTGVSSRFEAAAQRGFTAYAGREAELRTLSAALDQARAGRGQFVTVMGEPGIGKSRLLFEFRHGVPREQAVVLTGHCQSYGTDTPYLPMVDALRRGLRLEEAGGADALHDHVVKAVRAISPALERYLPQYLHLLSIPSAEHPIPKELQGDALRRAFEEAFAAILTENARRQPMALILEDWHWADEASDSALRHLAGLVPHHPLQVVVSYRPDYERKWANPQNYQPLVLQPLGEAETAAMLRSVWKAEQLPDGLAAQIHARTGGNALFNEEVARGLRDAGTVRVDDGRAVLSGDPMQLHLPDSVHAVIRARIDRLDPDSREVLRLASVIGREFTLPLLERLYPSPAKLHHALDALAHQDLIHPLRVVPEPAYLFKHALVQDVVYDTLLLSQRKELHEQVGAAIEALYADRLEEQFEALAHHYSQSEDVEKAIEYLEKAGDKAAARFSIPTAGQFYKAALARIQASLDQDKWKTRFIDVTLKRARITHYAPTVESLELLTTASSLARVGPEREKYLTVLYWIARLRFIRGEIRKTLTICRLCRRLGGVPPESDVWCLIKNLLGRTTFFSANFTEAERLLKNGIADAESRGDLEEAAYSYNYVSLCQAWIGRFHESLRTVGMARALSERTRNQIQVNVSQIVMGFVKQRIGDWEDAKLALLKGFDIAGSIGATYHSAAALSVAGYAAFMAGEQETGFELTLRGCALGEEHRVMLNFGYLRSLLAEMYARSGCPGEAITHADFALGFQREGDRIGVPIALRAKAMALSTMGEGHWEAAKANFALSMERAESTAAWPDAAITHHDFACALACAGQVALARREVEAAIALFREMEMTWWSEQAQALRGRIERGEKFVWFAPYVDGPPKV